MWPCLPIYSQVLWGPYLALNAMARAFSVQTKDSAARYADSVSHKRDRMASVLAKGFLKRKDDGRYGGPDTKEKVLQC